MKNTFIRSAIFFYFFIQSLSAQVTNCTVNAGIGNGVFCAGDVIKLDGNMAGQIQPGSLQWTQVFGPPCVVQNADQLEAKAIPSASGPYVFKISATCAIGTAEQTVTHVVEPKDNPDAGPDQTVACYPSGGVELTGFSTPPPGTLANWEASGSIGSVQGGVFRLFDGVCFSSPQTITLTYIVENANHCTYTDTKKLTINEAQAPVTAWVFGGCGQNYSAAGSCTGAGSGMWTFVGNAYGASFTAPTSTSTGFAGLSPGKTYTVRWTVTGGCSGGGHDETTFTYPVDNTAPTSADITNLDQLGSVASGGVYMCGVPDSILLFGTQPNPAAHEVGTWTLNTQPCDPFLGANNFPPALQIINDYTALVLNQGPGAFEVTYRITDTLRGCFTLKKVYFELETPGAPITYTASFKSCGGKELSPYNYGCSGISVTNVVWDPQDVYSTYPISFHELPDPGNNLRFNLKSGSFAPVAGPPGNPPQIQGGNCLNYTLHDFEYVLALHNSAPSGTYVYSIPMVYGRDISPCGNPSATIVMEVSTPPSPANAGSDVYICDTNTSLAGNTVSTPQWFLIKKVPSNAANPIFSSPDGVNTDLSGLSPAATYFIGYRSYGGIYCNSFTDTVVVRTAQTAPQTPNAGSNQSNVCYGMPVTLSATPNPVQAGTSGHWRVFTPASATVTFSQPNNPVTTVNGLLANTAYTFEYKVKNGCDSLVAMVSVNTNNTEGPSQPFAGSNICLPLGTTNIPLTGSALAPGITGQWISAAGNPSAVTFANPGSSSTTATVGANGNYYLVWQVSKPGCGTVSDTVLATLSAPALAKIPDNYAVYCNTVPPVTVPLTALSPAPGVGQWSLYDGNPAATIADAGAANTSTTLPAVGAYRYYWKVSNGACSNGKDSISIYVGGVPDVATVGQNTVTLCGSSNGELTLNGNAPTNPNNLGFWTVEPVSPNIMSAGIDAYLNGSSLITPNATVRLRPGKTRLRWNIVPGPPCAAAPSIADVLVDYVPVAQIVPDEDTIHVCNSPLVTLNAISPGTSGTGTWTKVSGPTVYGLPTTQQDNAPLIVGLTGGFGVYKFRYSVTSGSCPATEDLITVVNDSIFTAPNLGADTSFCVAGTELVLKGSNLPAGTFMAEWKKISGPGSGTFSPNANEQQVTFGPVQNGEYVFEYKITNGGCAFVDVIKDTINLATPFAGADTIVCATQVQLLATTDGKTWSAQSGNPSTATIHPVTGQVTGMGVPGDYFFIMHDPNTGCDDVVKVSSKAVAQITQEPSALTECAGGAGTLVVAANNNAQGNQFQWQSAGAAGGPFVNVGSPSSAANFAPPSGVPGLYFYRAIADNGACRDTSTVVQVQILPAVESSALPSTLNLCPGEKDTLSTIAAGGQGPLSYQWQSASVAGGPWSNIGGANSMSYIVSNQTPGTFYIRSIASTPGIGCADTVGITTVLIKPLPNAAISAAGVTTFCQGGSVTLNGSTGAGYSWQWYKDGIAISNAVSANHAANASGTYTLQTTLNGCSSTSTPIVVNVNPAPNATLSSIGNASICSGQNGEVQLTVPMGSNLAYNWYQNGSLMPGNTTNMIVVSQLGAYQVVVTNSQTGCSASSNVIQVQQSQSPTASFTHPADLSLCPGSGLAFTSTSSGSNLVYQWLMDGAPITGATASTYAVTAAGNYALVANQNGCFDTTAVVVVTQQTPPVVQIEISGNTPACEGSPVALQTAQTFNSYLWSNMETGQSTTVTQNGTYVVTVTDAEDCTNTATISLSLMPQPVVSLSGPDRICQNAAVQFNASSNAANAAFIWNIGNSTGAQLLAYLNSDITIVVTVTDTNGCSNTASSPIDVVNVPNLALDGNDPFAICKGSSLTLTVQGANTYRWSNGSQNNSITVSPLSSSTYSVIGVTDPLCPDTLTTEVTVHEPLLDGTTTESVACEPQVSLSGNIPEGGSGYWQTLTGAGVILQPDQAMTLAEDLSIGDNIFQWIVSNPPCPEIDTHRIVVHLSAQLPVAAPDDTIIIVDEAVRIQVLLNDSIAHLPGYTLEWKEKDENGVWELSPSGIVTFTPSASFTGMAHAVYVLCNKDCQEYCSEATITLVYRRPKDDIGQTQVITPNEDGKNDGLIFDYLDQYPKNSIVIFNRWGQRVYEAAPYNNDLPWEGTYKGKPLPAGTYYYILNLRGSDDAVWGNVLILR